MENFVTVLEVVRPNYKVNPEEDGYYINEVLSGNREAFRILVERHQHNVFNIVFQIVRNAEDSEEIAQDVFLKVYRSLHTFRSEAKFSTWLYRIAYNAGISRIRRKGKTELEMREEMVPDEDNFSGNQEDPEEVLRHLPAAIETLSDTDQLLITLYYNWDQGTEEIAEITGFSRSNVKVRLHRARKQLYKYISQRIELEKRSA